MTKNGRSFSNRIVDTSFGKTYIHTLNEDKNELPALVIFPGARTCGMVWDTDGALQELSAFRLFLVEVNGQPSLSEGFCPSQKNNDYGIWRAEILDALHLEQCYLAGGSLGGIICMKIAAWIPDRIKTIYLLNSAGLGSFSMKWKNLSMNMLPLFSPSPKNIQKFVQYVVLHSPEHTLDRHSEELLIDYLHHAITEFKFKGSYPSPLSAKDLAAVKTDCVLLFGTSDPLFPYENSLRIAKQHLKNIRNVLIFENVGHGIETYRPALKAIADDLKISKL